VAAVQAYYASRDPAGKDIVQNIYYYSYTKISESNITLLKTSAMDFRLLLGSSHSEERVVIVDGVEAVPYLSFSTGG
jgi:hypothetical protein